MLKLSVASFVLAAIMLLPLAFGQTARHASQWGGGFAFMVAGFLLLWLRAKGRQAQNRAKHPAKDEPPDTPDEPAEPAPPSAE